MAVTVVVGGQFGSEGKGKVAQFLVRDREAIAAVRAGGPNSGHTGIAPDGEAVILRQLPTAALLPDVLCVIGPGSYLDLKLLQAEVQLTQLEPDRLLVDKNAVIVTEADGAAETSAGLTAQSDRLLAARAPPSCEGWRAAVTLCSHSVSGNSRQ
jgi:adenylosuccinate synthase